eukprot:2912752-Prorocentrum_lima.AAC.1
MHYANTTWDLVDLMSIILEILILETDDTYEKWSVRLHTNGMTPDNAEQQVQAFREKWKVLRPSATVAASDKYHKAGWLNDGVYSEICKNGTGDHGVM